MMEQACLFFFFFSENTKENYKKNLNSLLVYYEHMGRFWNTDLFYVLVTSHIHDKGSN